ncbi:MAG TPA: fasciclin domain-containing protein [Mycobacteriales bacterium]|nr:fasciclin domain-containing protein [Mycobacteriales bacterium]
MKTSRPTRLMALPAAALLALGLAACGSDDDTAADSGSTPAPAATSTDSMDSGSTETASGEFGAACSAVPADGEGSFSGMSDDPVATAASNNPVLSTLVQAVQAAGLVDTLNNAENITVFAPTNDAFAAIPEADLQAVLADQELLTSILTYHVVGETIEPEQLENGSFTTLQGATLETSGSGESFTTGPQDAQIVCGNVMTANARVYIIDTVMMPPSA